MARTLFVALKVFITVGLLAYLLMQVDLGPIIATLGDVNPLSVLGAVVLLFAGAFLATMRWEVIQEAIGPALPLRELWRISLVSMFCNQLLPLPVVSGDVVRIVLLKRVGIALNRGTTSVLLDRISAALAMVALPLFVIPILPWTVPNYVFATLAFAVVVAAGSVVMLQRINKLPAVLTPAWLKELLDISSEAARHLFFPSWSMAKVFGLSCLSIILVALSFLALCLGSLHTPIDVATSLFVVPLAILLTLLPVSIAGWGVREMGLVAGFGLAGADLHDILPLALVWGVCNLMLGVPGAFVWGRTPMERRIRTERGTVDFADLDRGHSEKPEQRP